MDVSQPGGTWEETWISAVKTPRGIEEKQALSGWFLNTLPTSISLSEPDREKSTKRFPTTKPKAMKNE